MPEVCDRAVMLQQASASLRLLPHPYTLNTGTRSVTLAIPSGTLRERISPGSLRFATFPSEMLRPLAG